MEAIRDPCVGRSFGSSVNRVPGLYLRLSSSKSGRLFWCFWIDYNVPFGRPTLCTRLSLKAMMIYGLTTVLAMNFEMYYNFKSLTIFRKKKHNTGNSWILSLLLPFIRNVQEIYPWLNTLNVTTSGTSCHGIISAPETQSFLNCNTSRIKKGNSAAATHSRRDRVHRWKC